VTQVIDLSATPFFLRGSGYAEGTLFPWTMSDFSPMDAIESGIVKLPRVPVADNIPGSEMPMFRDVWEHIRKDMPKKGRGKAAVLDPLKLPVRLQTALEALYGHYEKTYDLWEKVGIRVQTRATLWRQSYASAENSRKKSHFRSEKVRMSAGFAAVLSPH
jgi:type III restriction enzyme